MVKRRWCRRGCRLMENQRKAKERREHGERKREQERGKGNVARRRGGKKGNATSPLGTSNINAGDSFFFWIYLMKGR